MKKKNEKSLRHKVRNAFLESFDKNVVAWNVIQDVLDQQLIEAIEFSLKEKESKEIENEK